MTSLTPVLLTIGKTLQGFSIGLFCSIILTYCIFANYVKILKKDKEISPSEIRGRICTHYQIYFIIGSLIATILSFSLPEDNSAMPKKVLLGTPLIFLIAQIILIFVLRIKETAKYYYLKGSTDKCMLELKKMYINSARIEKEFENFQQHIEDKSSSSFSEQVSGWNSIKLKYGVLISAAQQLSGVNVNVFFSGVLIFAITNHSELDRIYAITNALACLFFVCLGLFFIDSIFTGK